MYPEFYESYLYKITPHTHKIDISTIHTPPLPSTYNYNYKDKSHDTVYLSLNNNNGEVK